VSRFGQLLEDFFYRPDEEPGRFFEVVDAPEVATQPVPSAKDEAASEFLAFVLDEETWAIPIDVVREIVRVPPLTEIPRGERALLGVMNLRGEVLPVYDLKLRLGLTTEPALIAGPEADLTALGRSARILVLRSEDGDGGILVDKVLEVARFLPSELEAPARGVGAGERSFAVGLARRKERLFILLDPERALP
jgi:purine-binding chemotaxis protein CheW